MSTKNRKVKQAKDKKKKESVSSAIQQISEVEIFNVILTKDAQLGPVISNLEQQFEQDAESDVPGFDYSFLILVCKICGLGSVSNKIKPDAMKASLDTLLEKIYDEPDLLENNSVLYLIDKKDQNHKHFVDNHLRFWSLLFGQQSDVLYESKILEKIFQWSTSLASCKIRPIRAAIIQMLNVVLNRGLKRFQQLNQLNSQTKANYIKRFVLKVYKDILKERLKDIDEAIRLKLYQIILMIYEKIPKEVLTTVQLSSVFNSIFEANEENKFIELNALIKLYSKKIDHRATLVGYANSIINQLLISIEPNRKQSASLAELVNLLSSYDLTVQVKEALVIQTLCRCALKGTKALMKNLSQTFYKLNFAEYRESANKSDLSKINKKLIVSCLVLKFHHLEDVRTLQHIYNALIDINKSVMDVEQLFVLLLEGTLFKLEGQVKMTLINTKNLLRLIVAFVKYINDYKQDKKERQEDFKSKILAMYDRSVFAYSKEIFFKHIPQNKPITLQYLRLYQVIQVPISPNYQTYVDMIVQQLIICFQRSEDRGVIRASTGLIKRIYNKNMDFLMDQISFEEIQDLNHAAILKYCGLIVQINSQRLLSINWLAHLMRYFSDISDIRLKLDVLTILHHAHLWKIMNMFNTPNEDNFKGYIDFRDQYIQFVEFHFSNNETAKIIKQTLYNLICETLCLVMSNKLYDVPIMYFEVKSQMMDSLFRYLNLIIAKSEENDLSGLFEKLTIKQEMEEKEQNLVKGLLKICENSIRFALQPLSIHLIESLLLNQHNNKPIKVMLYKLVIMEYSKQNENRFVFWKIFKQMVMKEKQLDKVDKLVSELLDIYFSRKLDKEDNKRLQNKLILFVAENIELAFNDSNHMVFYSLEAVIKKSYRRYQKIILSKLYAHFQGKFTRLSEEVAKEKYILNFKKSLEKLSKLSNEKRNQDMSKKKMIQQGPNQEQEQIQEQNQNSESQQSDLDLQPARNTRSKTKKQQKSKN